MPYTVEKEVEIVKIIEVPEEIIIKQYEIIEEYYDKEVEVIREKIVPVEKVVEKFFNVKHQKAQVKPINIDQPKYSEEKHQGKPEVRDI